MAMATDPVCGMQVDERTAAGSSIFEGSTFYFCSAGCKKKFDANPSGYVGARPPAGNAAPAEHAPQRDPPAGDSSGTVRDMPVTAAVVAPGTIYTCPMHPEIRQVGPGKCPKCGMALEPLLATAAEDNSELHDMTRRFWVSVALALPLLVITMSEFVPGLNLHHLVDGEAFNAPGHRSRRGISICSA
jgi:Cu+-exporting ATPase